MDTNKHELLKKCILRTHEPYYDFLIFIIALLTCVAYRVYIGFKEIYPQITQISQISQIFKTFICVICEICGLFYRQFLYAIQLRSAVVPIRVYSWFS